VGDGRTLDTGAVQKAIDACAIAGGGQVLFPAGDYLSGTIHLRSKVTLFLDRGARLVGSPALGHYRRFTPPPAMPEARFPARWHRALILGDGLEDVAIAGEGVIDGNRVFDAEGEDRMRGPHTVLLGNCRKVAIRDLRIEDSANYAVLLELCDDVEVKGLTVTGGWDGVHFRGAPGRPCRRVAITDCRFHTGDDAIAGRYWEDTLIAGCVINSSCSAVRLIGPALRLSIRDSLIYGPGLHEHLSSRRRNALAGLNLQPGAWDATEGLLDDVAITDLTLRDVATPLHCNLQPGNRAGRITVARVRATGIYQAAMSVESWTTAPFEQVAFRDVDLAFAGGGTRAEARRKARPPGVDPRPLPAWGFYARNVQDLRLEGVRLRCGKEDLRPALFAERVGRLDLEGFRCDRFGAVPEPLVFRDVGQVRGRGLFDKDPAIR
jgi:hypothetical protein